MTHTYIGSAKKTTRMQQRITDLNFIGGFNNGLNTLLGINTINPVLSRQFSSFNIIIENQTKRGVFFKHN